MYKKLASDIFFTNVGPCTPASLSKYHLQYREGKGFSDLFDAKRKALKNGQAKIETELSFFELYLKMVLKPIKGVK